MNPVRQIIQPQWMTDSFVTPVMQVLGGYEASPKSLFVGGCVRNHLLGVPVSDIDVATTYRPDIVMNKLLKAGIRAIPTGMAHGTVTAIVDDMPIEITTLRRDIEADGRHAVISFSDSWEEDAQRRDFTMNTLLCSVAGNLYDPTGQGVRDLEARKVVFVGQASQRIAEDYLRILRFFRFHAQYGEGNIDQDGLDACKFHAEHLVQLSRERVTQELLKILSAPKGAKILQLMSSEGIFKSFALNRIKEEPFERLKEFQSKYDAKSDWTHVLLLCGLEDEKYNDFLALSNAQKKNLKDIETVYKKLTLLTKKKVRQLVYRYGNHAVLQAYLLKLSVKSNHPDLDIIDIARYWHAPVFSIGGEDLIRKGYQSGPALGKKLKELEEKWITSDFKALPKF
jgi:poly(A) polymerase